MAWLHSFMLTQEGQNNPVQFAEIFAKMVSPLHDFELFVLLCAFCEFKIFCIVEFLKM
jgi:hypothetical protein